MISTMSARWSVFCALLMLLPTAGNTESLSYEQLIQDTHRLSEILESTHPDPYTKGGGKIAFHRRLQELLCSIPETGMTSQEYQKILLPFVAAVGDGHTRIHVEYERDQLRPGGIPLQFSVVGRSLYVSGVVGEEQRPLLGSVLVSVEGVAFDSLCDRTRSLRGTDNEYGILSLLQGRSYLWYRSELRDLIPEWETDSIDVTLRLPAGRLTTARLSTVLEIEEPLIHKESAIRLPSTERCEFAWDFLDEEGSTAILRIDGMGGFRENFELVGLESDFHLGGARYFYERYHQTAAPEDKSDLLEGIPSATEAFKSLVLSMSDHKTEVLVVDLRENGGGNSTLAHFLVYLLYGKDRLIDHFALPSEPEVLKLSDLYFSQNRDASLEELNADSNVRLQPTDYWFDDIHGRAETTSRTESQEMLANLYAKIPAFNSEYTSELYSGYYCPEKVFVLNSPNTYSSGYTMMKMLNAAGATLVGVPSSQAENAPGWTLNFRLQHSGLAGWVPCKFYSSKSSRIVDGVYQLDHELTYEKLKSFEFDPNSSVLYALELADW